MCSCGGGGRFEPGLLRTKKLSQGHHDRWKVKRIKKDLKYFIGCKEPPISIFEDDDDYLSEINRDYRSGKILAGEMKQLCIDRATDWLSELSEKRDETAHLVKDFFVD